MWSSSRAGYDFLKWRRPEGYGAVLNAFWGARLAVPLPRFRGSGRACLTRPCFADADFSGRRVDPLPRHNTVGPSASSNVAAALGRWK